MTVETLSPTQDSIFDGGEGQPLDRLLRPRSIVIIGASDKPGALGASVLSNLIRNGFAGGIHLINPKRSEIGGRPCLSSIDDLPDGVDAAVLAIPRVAVLDAIKALAARHVGAAVIFSAGFAEGGEEGLADQREIGRIAAESGMVIEGPNCLGMTNFIDRVPLTFVETDIKPLGDRAGIGIVSQSGAMACVLSVTLASREGCGADHRYAGSPAAVRTRHSRSRPQSCHGLPAGAWSSSARRADADSQGLNDRAARTQTERA